MVLAYKGGTAKMTALLCLAFTTYNIRRTHGLKWEMVLSVAKETITVLNSHFVRFVASYI